MKNTARQSAEQSLALMCLPLARWGPATFVLCLRKQAQCRREPQSFHSLSFVILRSPPATHGGGTGASQLTSNYRKKAFHDKQPGGVVIITGGDVRENLR